MLNIGVVGCGRNAKSHLDTISALRGMKVSAVCDTDEERANRAAARYRVEKVFHDYNRLIELGNLDLVDIITPTSTHSEIAIAAADAGRNVLVEKPMALGTMECEAMIRKAEKRGVMLCVFHNKRFYRCVTETEAAIDSEGLHVRTVALQMHVPPAIVRMGPQWRTTDAEGGFLWEAVVHPVYIALRLMSDVRGVFTLGSKAVMPVQDNFSVLLEGSRGDRGYVELSLDQLEGKFTLEVTTEEGHRFEGNMRTDYLFKKNRRFRGFTWDTLRALYDDLLRPMSEWSRHSINVLVRGRTPEQRIRFELMTKVADHLRGVGDVPVPGDEGLEAVRVLEAVRRSLDEGQRVDVLR